MPRNPTIRLRRDQLAKFRAVAGLKTDTALAARMGLASTTVARTLSGDAKLTTGFIESLLAAFPGLSLDDLVAVEYAGAEDEDFAEAIPA